MKPSVIISSRSQPVWLGEVLCGHEDQTCKNFGLRYIVQRASQCWHARA